jgi:hypothetical protein
MEPEIDEAESDSDNLPVLQYRASDSTDSQFSVGKLPAGQSNALNLGSTIGHNAPWLPSQAGCGKSTSSSLEELFAVRDKLIEDVQAAREIFGDKHELLTVKEALKHIEALIEATHKDNI